MSQPTRFANRAPAEQMSHHTLEIDFGLNGGSRLSDGPINNSRKRDVRLKVKASFATRKKERKKERYAQEDAWRLQAARRAEMPQVQSSGYISHVILRTGANSMPQTRHTSGDLVHVAANTFILSSGRTSRKKRTGARQKMKRHRFFIISSRIPPHA